MTKTHFIKTYNLYKKLSIMLISTVVTYGISLGFIYKINNLGQLSKKLPFSFMLQLFTQISVLSIVIFVVTLISILIIIGVEIADRKINDSLNNIFLSVSATIQNKKWLHHKIDENGNKVIPEQLFNEAIKYLVIDITNDNYIIYVKTPNIQAYRELKKNLTLLIEVLTDENEDKDISFSPLENKNKEIWIKGTKK